MKRESLTFDYLNRRLVLDAGRGVARAPARLSQGARFWLPTLIVGLSFFLIDQNPAMLHVRSWDDEILSVDQRTEMTADGSLPRKIGFIALGALGAVLCSRPTDRRLRWTPSFVVCVAFVGLSVVSFAWSDDPGVTLRRLISFLCLALAALGISRQFSPLDFVRLVFCIAAVTLPFAFAVELGTGRFLPWVSGYRFAGLLHPNNQGVQAALFALSALALASIYPRYRALLIVLVVAAIVTILLTKSRTSLAAAVLAAGLSWLASPGRAKWMWVFAAATVACAGVLFIEMTGENLEQLVADAFFMGRKVDTDTLTGRTPLWEDLMLFARERPTLGYGYGAFWNNARSLEVFHVVGWAVPDAHSSFIDAMLAIGYVGAVLLGLLLATGLLDATLAFRRTGDVGYRFFIAAILVGCLVALTESDLMLPSPLLFTLFVAVGQVAYASPAPIRQGRLSDLLEGAGR